MDQLEEIKSKIDIVQFISEYLPLKKTGQNFKALCPFHTEKTPSFIVSAERQIWHCFGACSTGGDIFGFLMKIENLEFPEALRILAKKAGVVLKRYEPTETTKLKERLYEINHLASEFYHYLLLNHRSGESARQYVHSRGINPQSLMTFKLGYAPALWDGLISFLTKKGYLINDLERAGLVVRSEKGKGLYDRFRQRLIFTLKNHRGEIVGFSGRLLDPEEGEAKYINTPETPIYFKGNLLYGLDVTREIIKRQNQAIIMEGEIDVIASFQAGIQNVVAIKGSALSQGQVNLIKRYTENIALALDMDLAGDTAARRGIEIADSANLNIKVIQLHEGKDPDECIRKNPKFWFESVKQALPLYDFLITSAVARYEKTTAEGKKKIGEEVASYLVKITNEIVKNHYVKKLAGILEVSEEAILATMEKIGTGKSEGETPINTRKPKNREEILEEYLLSLILQAKDSQEVLSSSLSNLQPGDFSLSALAKIFLILSQFLKKKEKFKITHFIKSCPKELEETVDRLYLTDLGSLPDSPKFLSEIEKTTREIKKSSLKRKLREISRQIKETKEEKKVRELNQEITKSVEELKSLNH